MGLKMVCPYCGNSAKYGPNEEFYNGKRYGKSYMCYYCKPCDAYVGCHENTKKPLGTMANKKLRDLRTTCHSLFDPLWKDGEMIRKEAYQFLFIHTGVKHIAWTTEKECKKIIQVLMKGEIYEQRTLKLHNKD